MGVLGVLGPAPQVESKSSGFRWEHDLPVRVPGLSLWHRSQAVRLHCQFVAPLSPPARNGKGTLGGERCRSGQWAGIRPRPHRPQVLATWSLRED